MNIYNAVNPLWVAIVFFAASMIKLYQNQKEQSFSRFAISVWYLYIFFVVVPEEHRSLVGRWMFMQLAVLEIVSFFLRTWMKDKYKKALDNIGQA